MVEMETLHSSFISGLNLFSLDYERLALDLDQCLRLKMHNFNYQADLERINQSLLEVFYRQY